MLSRQSVVACSCPRLQVSRPEKIGLSKSLPYPREEIHVKLFMLRHRRDLGLSEQDVDVLKEMIRRHVVDSKVDLNGQPLTMPDEAR